MHRRAAVRIAAVLGACVMAGVTVPVASAQDQNVLFVRVLDLVGQPVTDLAADDFVVSEDGRRARVVAATAGTEPMRVALLIDNGESVRGSHAVIALRSAVAAFLETLPPEHPVGLFTIGGHPRRMVDFTTDRAPLVAAARSLFFNQAAGVVLADGLRDTWERHYTGDEAWPVFVALVKSATEVSRFLNERRYLRFVNRLRRAGVIVHVVHWYVRARGDIGGMVTTLAPNLARDTGGRYASVLVPTAMADAMTALATDMGVRYRDLSSRYRLVYERPDPPGSSVTVRVERANIGLTRLFPDRRIDP